VNYRADIDGIRCLAVLFVVIFHFHLVSWLEAGFIGVDIFFVISGYLITRKIWAELQSGDFRLADFFVARFRRLGPALIFTQILVLAVAILIALPNETISIAKQSLAVQTYVANIYFYKTISYFGAQAKDIVLLHMWSLGLEEQFYIFCPLVMIAIHRFWRHLFKHIIIAGIIFSFCLNLFLVKNSQAAAFYLLPPRAWELLLGAAVAFCEPAVALRPRLRMAAASIGALMIAAAVMFYVPKIAFPGYFALLPVGGTGLLLLAGSGGGSAISRMLALAPFRHVGKISYSLYLIHWPVNVYAAMILTDYSLFWRWAGFALSLVIAQFMYVYIETPFRHRSFRLPDRRFAAGFGLTAVPIALSALLLLQTQGWRSRLSPSINALADAAADRDPATDSCDWKMDDDRKAVCALGRAGSEPKWLVMGDSHTGALASAFSQALSARGEAGRLIFAHGCLPVDGLGDSRCRAFNDWVDKWLGQHPGVRRVVIVSMWRQVQTGLEDENGNWLVGKTLTDASDERFRETLTIRSAGGRAIYIWEPLPLAKRSIPETMARNVAFGRDFPIAPDYGEYRRGFSFLWETLDRNKGLIAGLISPARMLCPHARCAVSYKGRPLYYDRNHPAFSQSRLFGAMIGRDIAKAETKLAPPL
jgi:peptidoglycan/LPS O-acetylase OafA/YrhL